MPTIRTVNLRRDDPDVPEPSGVETFFSNLQKDYRERQDKAELDSIISGYQQNRQDENALEDLFLNISNSRLGPTKQLQAIETAKNVQKTIADRNKNLNEQMKNNTSFVNRQLELQNKQLERQLKESSERNEVKIIANKIDFDTPEEKEEFEKNASPQTARERYRIQSQAKAAEKNVADKKNTEQQENDKSQKIVQTAYDDLVSLVPKVGVSGIVTSNLGGKTANAYAEFTSLTGALESLLVEKVNRGTLSNTRFKYITETLLPKPSDSQETIKGKLKGLATILELDDSKLMGKAKSNKDPHEGMVQVRDPNGVLRWVPKDIADQLKGK